MTDLDRSPYELEFPLVVDNTMTLQCLKAIEVTLTNDYVGQLSSSGLGITTAFESPRHGEPIRVIDVQRVRPEWGQPPRIVILIMPADAYAVEPR